MDQNSYPQSRRTPRGINIQPTKWTDPLRIKLFDKVHRMDRPHEGTLLDKFTKWTDTCFNKYAKPRTGSPFNIFSE